MNRDVFCLESESRKFQSSNSLNQFSYSIGYFGSESIDRFPHQEKRN